MRSMIKFIFGMFLFLSLISTAYAGINLPLQIDIYAFENGANIDTSLKATVYYSYYDGEILKSGSYNSVDDTSKISFFIYGGKSNVFAEFGHAYGTPIIINIKGYNNETWNSVDAQIGPIDMNFTKEALPIILVNEFESNPASGNEWIELYNPNNDAVDISSWQLWDSLASPSLLYTFPASTVINAKSFLTYDLSSVKLNNADEKVVLKHSSGQVVDESAQKADNGGNNNCWARLPNGLDTDSDSDWTFQTCTKGWSNDDNDNDGFNHTVDCDDTNLSKWQNLSAYVDADKDGFGTGSQLIVCSGASLAAGYSAVAGDCNDNNADINPNATELCNNIDDDCDSQTDEDYNVGNACSVDLGECANSGQYVCTADNLNTECNAIAGTPSDETCDGKDNNCDGTIDNGLTAPVCNQTGVCVGTAQTCNGVTGWSGCNYAGNSAFYETNELSCDSKDNDCDGNTDEGLTTTYYRDADSDTYGNNAVTQDACALPSGYVNDNTDCDDSRAAVNPSATEVCDNGLDDDCDGDIDDSDIDCYACTIDAECSGMDNQCNDGKCNLGTHKCYADPKADDTVCDDGLYCTVSDKCTSGTCGGTARVCSGNNIAVAECTYSPDSIGKTYDYYSFNSVCNENADACTSAAAGWQSSITHTCDIAQCGADCEDNSDCDATECDSNDGCYSGTYRNYNNVNNDCTSGCECEDNACSVYTNIITDNDNDGYDTECDADCNDNNKDVNPGKTEVCDNGLDDDCDGDIDDSDTDCYACTIDAECSGMDNQCNDGKCNLGTHKCYADPKADDTVCDDGLYCTVSDKCTSGTCGGTARVCSGNNIAVAECTYSPDSIGKTYDYYSFNSVCNENADACTSAAAGWQSSITHTCDIAQCGADCEDNSDCDATECVSLSGCYNGVYRTYRDVGNDCTSGCECEDNACSDYDEDSNDIRCGAVADANGSYSCDEGDSITLDGSGSYSKDGTIASYNWDLDNDGSFDDATGVSPNYDCLDDYDGKIRLKVIDSNGREGIDETNLKVDNVNPTVAATGSAEGDVGVAVNFGGTGTDVPADTLSYSWNFGDGSSSNQEDPSHIYTAGGKYTVELTVTDDDGGSDKDTLSIDIYETRKIPIDKNVSIFSLPVIPKTPVTFNDINDTCVILNGPAYYNEDTDGYVTAGPNGVLYPGQGYFIKVEDACNLKIRGLPFDYDNGKTGYEGSGTLKSGWNMIGAASKETHYWYVKGDCVFTLAAGSSGPWGYDGSLQGDPYFLTAFLKSGKGYWVKVPSACSFTGKART